MNDPQTRTTVVAHARQTRITTATGTLTVDVGYTNPAVTQLMESTLTDAEVALQIIALARAAAEVTRE